MTVSPTAPAPSGGAAAPPIPPRQPPLAVVNGAAGAPSSRPLGAGAPATAARRRPPRAWRPLRCPRSTAPRVASSAMSTNVRVPRRSALPPSRALRHNRRRNWPQHPRRAAPSRDAAGAQNALTGARAAAVQSGLNRNGSSHLPKSARVSPAPCAKRGPQTHLAPKRARSFSNALLIAMRRRSPGVRPRTRDGLVRGGVVLWSDVVDGSAGAACLSEDAAMCAVGCSDGALYLFGGGGTRLLPPLMLGAPITHAECSISPVADAARADAGPERLLLVICADGSLRLWETTAMRLVLAESVRPALSSMALGAHSATPSLPQIEHCAIGKGGAPLLVLSLAPGQIVARAHDDGGGAMQAFTWQHEMRCWLRIADTRFVLSEFFSLLDSVPLDPFLSKGATDAPKHRSPSCRLDARAPRPRRPRRRRAGAAGPLSASARCSCAVTRPPGKADAMEAGCSRRAHLEDRIASAVAIESSSEFVHWLRPLRAPPRRFAEGGVPHRGRRLARARPVRTSSRRADRGTNRERERARSRNRQPQCRGSRGGLRGSGGARPEQAPACGRRLAFASNRALQPVIRHMEARMVEGGL